jgi:hypothetical protein
VRPSRRVERDLGFCLHRAAAKGLIGAADELSHRATRGQVRWAPAPVLPEKGTNLRLGHRKRTGGGRAGRCRGWLSGASAHAGRRLSITRQTPAHMPTDGGSYADRRRCLW